MYLSKIIPIELYDTKVEFILTSNIVRTFNRIHKKHELSTRWKEAPAGCMIGFDMSHYYILINSEYISYNTIIHELTHACYAITSDRYIQDDEARCWLSGLLAEVIFAFLKSKDILNTI